MKKNVEYGRKKKEGVRPFWQFVYLDPLTIKGAVSLDTNTAQRIESSLNPSLPLYSTTIHLRPCSGSSWIAQLAKMGVNVWLIAAHRVLISHSDSERQGGKPGYQADYAVATTHVCIPSYLLSPQSKSIRVCLRCRIYCT